MLLSEAHLLESIMQTKNKSFSICPFKPQLSLIIN